MASGVLNFDVVNKITGVNVIDGHLLFTDNRNEPRKVNIARFRDEGDHTSGTTNIYGRPFQASDITVIKKHPVEGPTTAVLTTDTASSEFEKTFPRVSYRWKFKDHEYSPYAPFSQVIYQSEGDVDYIDLYETGDFNNLKNIVDSFTVTVPVTEDNIIAVELLYTESISSTVYAVEEKEITASDLTTGTVNFTVDSRNLFKALPPSQLNRIFDEVPRKAKAQDLVGNRLIYGNFLEGYNNPNLTAVLDTTTATAAVTSLGVRTNSKYNVGVAFIDKFGRQGGLMDVGGVETPFKSSAPLKLTCRLTGAKPTWATHYRYYIKDTANPRFNIKSFAAFDNEEASEGDAREIWLAVTSDDVNKVQEGDIIYRRATSRPDLFPGIPGQANASYGYGGGFSNSSITYNRRKVLEIKNEAPESVKYGLIDKSLVSRLDEYTSKSFYEFAAYNGFYSASHTPEEGDTEIVIGGTDVMTAIGDELGESKIVYIHLGNNEDDLIRVTGATPVGTATNGATDGALISLATPLTASAVSGLSTSNNITVYSHQFDNKQLAVLEGKFFIKTTKESLVGTDSIDTEYYEAITFPHHLNDNFFSTLPNITAVSGDIFTVEAEEQSNLDLYWESSNAFECSTTAASDFGAINEIEWTNSIQLDGYLDVDKDLDKFNSVSFGKGVRVNTPIDDPSSQRHKNRLIFSGIINPNTKTNRLNEFIKADGITKDINPKYGSIQKLYAQDDLIVFCHDKVVKVLANKDALFNADENVNLIATPNVLGQAIAYKGNYGICDNPESFAVYGFNIYFTDRHRGCVLQLTPINGQINDISKRGMRDFFRDRLTTATSCVGSFDEYSGKYILSIQGYNPGAGLIDTPNFLPGESGITNANLTIGYHANGDQSGWTSRYSFIPEWGISTLGKYYTFNGGQCWLHHDGTPAHNNFYGTQYNSEVQFIFNDNPTASSEWVSLNYEGTPGWDCVGIEADQEEGVTSSVDILDSKWFKKEGKYFAPITGEEIAYALVTSGVPDADGNYPLQDTGQKHPKAGVKGFFNKVKLRNSETTKQELFALSAEYYISSQ